MLARLQRFITLGLLAFAVLWAGAAMAAGRPAWAAVGAVAVAVGYLAVMALEFVLAAALHGDDPAPRATPWQRVRAWCGEVTTSPRVFCWDQPFREHAVPDHLPANATGRGLVLVHGFVCNRAFWNRWMRRLRAQGVPFIAVSLEPVFGPIGDYADALDDAVRRMAAATGRPPVIVAHSMGGLVARAWLARRTGEVARVITIGTPHRGTWAARFGRSANSVDMRLGSPMLGGLEAAEPPTVRSRFTCFYSHCDNIVFPPSTATLEGADNRHVQGMAHVHLVDHPAVFAAALAAVADESRA